MKTMLYQNIRSRRGTRRHIPIVAFTALAVGLGSCKQVEQSRVDGRVSVTDGKIISESDHPAVVQIAAKIDSSSSANCTATWVSHNTIITAAHCIFERGSKLTDVRVRVGEGKDAKAVQILAHPKYVDAQSVPIDNYDVAVLIFPDQSSKHFIPVAPAQPKAGDEITIIGYGKYDHLDGKSSGKKRIGTNKLTDIDRQGRLNFEGKLRPTTGTEDGTGSESVNSQGDSGGPMLIASRIIGVSSTVDARPTAAGKLRGHYENLRHPPIEQFLHEATTKGAVIRGLKADDQITTPNPQAPVGDEKAIFVKVKRDDAGKIDLAIAAGGSAKRIEMFRFETAEALAAHTLSSPVMAETVTFEEVKANRAFFSASVKEAPLVNGGSKAPLWLKIRAMDDAGALLMERKVRVVPQ